jgi:hypothetical protein
VHFFDYAAERWIRVLKILRFGRFQQLIGVMVHFIPALGANHFLLLFCHWFPPV